MNGTLGEAGVSRRDASRNLKRWAPPLVAVLFGMMSLVETQAVILYGTGDPSANTTAPAGDLAGSGWDLQGNWGSFLGTPIAPNYFITAKHVGGSVGGTFSLGGTSYTTTAKFNSPDSDLTIWQVSGTFSSYAPLYTGSDEVGEGLVVFGRGTQRGAEVNVSGGVGGDLKGWLYGSSDGVMRWGENIVHDVVNGGTGFGELLQAGFFRALGGNVATLSGGDSGGAVFINDGGVWKLAGINYAVDGPFSYTSGGSTFNAALFDAGGLYYQNTLIADSLSDVAASMYATRISANLSWINSITPVPEPQEWGAVAGLGLIAFAMARRRGNV